MRSLLLTRAVLVCLAAFFGQLAVGLELAAEEPSQSVRPFISQLVTAWGEKVTLANAWREYPRPQLRRSNWQNLNGRWDYAVTPKDRRHQPEQWQGKILVPFCLESKLGGVQRLLQPDEALWYRRRFSVSEPRGESRPSRTLLNFEAVDYRCRVWLNGKLVGEHQGGNTPFSFDVTDAIRIGENELVVRVEDETEGWQLRGKQVLEPKGIWYTRVSGIWQTVWLEEAGPSYIEDITIRTDAERGKIEVAAFVAGTRPVSTIILSVYDGDRRLQSQAQVHPDARVPDPVLEMKSALMEVDHPKLWSPRSPHLYRLKIAIQDADGNVLDEVESYTAFRTVGKIRDADGHLRLTLNGKILFHHGPLDQGWWPDGLLTPPSDAAMRSDIEFLKKAGFNMIRKHIKVEPRRYYYHCDRLGMMVWQDHVSGGVQPKWTRLAEHPEDAEWPQEHHRQFMRELDWMIDNLENHPSIVMWVPFNEAWGQHRTLEVGQWVKKRDPTRLVNIASGGNFWPVGDVVDHHQYPHPGFPFHPSRYRDFIKVVGEFGGHGLVIRDHIWDASRRNWGYGGLPKNAEEYRERYVQSLKMLNELRAKGIAAGVYTQTSDVEGEVNGLLTYDRKVAKLSAEELADLHRKLLKPSPAEKEE